MSNPLNSCAVCDGAIDPHGRDGTRCRRCQEPCPTCEGDVAYCAHPLPEAVDGIERAQMESAYESPHLND